MPKVKITTFQRVADSLAFPCGAGVKFSDSPRPGAEPFPIIRPSRQPVTPATFRRPHPDGLHPAGQTCGSHRRLHRRPAWHPVSRHTRVSLARPDPERREAAKAFDGRSVLLAGTARECPRAQHRLRPCPAQRPGHPWPRGGEAIARQLSTHFAAGCRAVTPARPHCRRILHPVTTRDRNCMGATSLPTDTLAAPGLPPQRRSRQTDDRVASC